MNRLLGWLKTNPQRKAGALFFLALAVLVCIHAVDSLRSDVLDRTRDRLFMDSENGKTFTAELKVGMTIPVVSPYSGNATGYPFEECYWNADGTTKSTPTYVILNSYLGKRGPTFCPDCGRLVVAHNLPPVPGQRPPPTKAEFERLYHYSGN